MQPVFGDYECDLLLASYAQLCSYCIMQSEYEAMKKCCMQGTPLEIVNANYLRVLLKLISSSSSVFCRELLLQDLLTCMSNEKKKANMK